MDYLVYDYLQLGQDRKAQQTIEEMNALAALPYLSRGGFALAASPARYAVERGDWQGAAALPLRPSPGLPTAEAMTYFARALGAARSGQPAAA